MISIRFFSLKIEIDLFRSVAEIIINRQNQRIFILLLRLSAVQVKRQYKIFKIQDGGFLVHAGAKKQKNLDY